MIYTPMRTGESLDPKVMLGLADNNCKLIPVISDGGTRRENMHRNWKAAFGMFEGEYFIGMDSDVILIEGVIDKLIARIAEDTDLKMVTVETKQGPYIGEQQHSLFVAHESILNTFPEYVAGPCPMCRWINELKKAGYEIACLPGIQLTEV